MGLAAQVILYLVQTIRTQPNLEEKADQGVETEVMRMTAMGSDQRRTVM